MLYSFTHPGKILLVKGIAQENKKLFGKKTKVNTYTNFVQGHLKEENGENRPIVSVYN